MSSKDDDDWFDDYAEDTDEIQIDEYDITAAPNDFNILGLREVVWVDFSQKRR